MTYPRPSCHAVLIDGDAVLLVRRANEPFRGSWGLPGGAVELGETVVEALRREVREETGLEIEVGPLVRYKDAIGRDPDSREIRHHYVVLFFLAYPVGGRLRAASDAAEVRWVPRGRLEELQLVPDAAEIVDAAWRLRAGTTGPDRPPSDRLPGPAGG